MTGADVALITPYPRLDRSHHDGSSGVASYGANLARSLSAHGTRVHVVAPVEDGARHRERDDDIVVDRCLRTGSWATHDLADAVARTGAPVAHLQFELFLYGGAAALLGVLGGLVRLRRRRVPTAVTLHQTVTPATVDRDYTHLHRVPVPAPVARAGIATLQQAIRRITLATIVHEEPFRAVLGDATVIPHGIERMAPVDRDEARRALGIHDDRFAVLCFGFVAPYKGLEVALRAGELAGGDVEVVVAGAEHPRLAENGDDYARELQRRFGHGARFTGWVPGEDVNRWFSAADVAVFPYPEPFSSSGALALALAADTPVLLSAPLGRCVGAPSDLVASGPDQLAARIRAMADDAELALAHRSWTSCLADGRDWEAVAQRHLHLYRELAR